MTEKRTWFQRPLTALCILLGLTILSVYIIFSSDGGRENGKEIGFRITMRHYGSDAHEMETTTAVPLEDALSAIPGISRIVTASENGRVRAYVNFRNANFRIAEKDEYYDAVREAAQRVYETLPSSAQRPELSSSGDSRIPFWTCAVYGASGEAADGGLLERIVKPALSGIAGVGEVEIAGPGIREIIIALDQEKAAALNISPGKLSTVLAGNDALFSGGLLSCGGLEIPIKVDGRYSGLEALGEALIPLDSGGLVSLKTIAHIRERDREADTLSRLNGKRTAIISVTAASGTDHGTLSNQIKKELEKLSFLPLEWKVLEDRGAEEARAFTSVLAAALEASLLVALAAVLLGMGRSTDLKNGLICAGAIPLISIMSAALLCSAGFPVNRKFLAGLAVGIGGAVDAVILSAEGFGRARNYSEGKTILREIWSPLVSGAATTVAALLPLTGIAATGEITVIAAALGTVTLVSVVLALTVLPPLFLWEKHFGGNPGRNSKARRSLPALAPALLKKLRRRLFRFFTTLTAFCRKHTLVFPAVSLVIPAVAVFFLVITGTDTAGEWSEDSVYIQVEFEGGFLKEEGDLLLAAWAGEIKKHPAVREVQTGARTGSGYGLVSFDPREAKIEGIRNFIRRGTIPGAFIYIPEPSPGDRIWTITVSGDDADKCRELAREAAALCSSLYQVKETVLNFKQGGPKLSLIPRRELLAMGGISFSSPADTVRRGVHGPVAYKRTAGGETDVRVMFSSASAGMTFDGDEVLRIPLAVNSGTVRLDSLMKAVKTHDASGIQRENRRRIASFSIQTAPGDPRFFRGKTMEALKGLDLPPGYKIEFDPEAIRQAEALSGKLLNFIWAVLFCYMIIAATEESLVLPLIILSSVPLSLAVPVLLFILFKIPVNATVACALVAVSGMTVNASVISAGELWKTGLRNHMSVYRGLRNRIPALMATTGTTIAGAAPFLFIHEGNNALVRTLALVTVMGVGGAFFCSLTLVPSWMNVYFRFRIRRNLIR